MPRAKKIVTSNEAYNMPFAKRLRELLDTPGETQEKLANAIGASRQSIGQWKDGVTSPDINSLNKIANYFKVSSDYLLGRIDIKSPDADIVAICEKTGLAEETIKRLEKERQKYFYCYEYENEKNYGWGTDKNEILDEVNKIGGKNVQFYHTRNYIETIDLLVQDKSGIVLDISRFLFSEFHSYDTYWRTDGSVFAIKVKGQDAPELIRTSQINRVYLLDVQVKLIELKKKLSKESE